MFIGRVFLLLSVVPGSLRYSYILLAELLASAEIGHQLGCCGTLDIVSDVDGAKKFYEETLGFRVDVDHRAATSSARAAAVINERIGIAPHLSLPPFEYPPLTCWRVFARPNGNKDHNVLKYLLRSLAVTKTARGEL